MFNIVIFGPPGSGKGTQSVRVAEKYCLEHISTGELFRDEIIRGTSLGESVKSYMDKGILIPDTIVLRKLVCMVQDLKKARGVIFDGFPRTLFQAQMLDKYLAKKGIPLNLVIYINVKVYELFSRMIGRAKDSGRSDDNKPVMIRRMNIYDTYTKPLIDYYRNQGKLLCISGMAPVDIVSGRISNAIDEHMGIANVSL
jgi:adenylate kinase